MVTIRPAVKEDSADIAQLFLISSDGLAEYIWSETAEPGETPAERQERRTSASGRRCVSGREEQDLAAF